MRSKFLPLLFASPFLVSDSLAGQPKNSQLQQLPGRRVEPRRAASYTVVNGRMMLTSDWIPLNSPTTRDLFTCAWDCIELDLTGGVLGAPTDNSPGCNPTIPPGNRWFLGAAYSNPFVSADINGAIPGAACEGLGQAWYIDVGDSEPDTDGDGLPDSPLFIAVQQFENMDVVSCTDDGSNFIDGVIYDFSGNAWDPAFYNYTTIMLNGSGLFHTMPSDGSGGYQVIYGIAFDPITFTITIPSPIDTATGLGVNIQPMLWGTHNSEPTDDGRCGEDVDGQFDDDNPIDGVHDLALECYSYAFGVCPNPLAAATGFYFKDLNSPCACEGDLNGDGIVDIADLALLLSQFGSSDGGCDDINGDGITDISDLALILSAFGSTCTPPEPIVTNERVWQVDQADHGVVFAPNSQIGIYAASLLGSSNVEYLNVVGRRGPGFPDVWMVRNLPVVPHSSQPSYFDVFYTIDLTDLVTSPGVNLPNLETSTTVSPTPASSPPVPSQYQPRTVGDIRQSATGKPQTTPRTTVGNIPAVTVPFGPFGKFHWNFGMPNVECGTDECGPAACTNSLEWLRTTQGVNVPNDGLGGRLNTLKDPNHMKTNSRAPNETGTRDDEFIDGKLKYCGDNNINVTTEFQDDQLGGADRTVGGKTATARGTTPTAQFIADAINANKDVEIGITYLNPEPFTDTNGNGHWDPGEPFTDQDGNGTWSPEVPNGGHWVTAVGKIQIDGFIGIWFAEDATQGAPGGTRIGFSWLGLRGDGFRSLDNYPGGKNKIDIVVTEGP